MTPPGMPLRAKSAFQVELEVSGRQFKRLANCLMNKAFELTVKGSRRRNQMLIFLFLFIGVLFVLAAHSRADWQAEIGNLFSYFLDPSYASNNPNTPSLFFSFVLSAFFKPQTLRYLPVFLLPFIIALHSAATYLADIFELQEVRVAREFILQVALTGGGESVRIGGGDVSEKERHSPIYLIGGPGKIEVELDTAALFEKPDGKPHVIGPTVKGKVALEGFERFRQAIDLRDQYTDSLDVTSRSLDGIPVGTTDVRMVFSVARDKRGPTTESPYPFDEKAIETLVYGQACRVVLDGPNPSECDPSWSNVIQGLIRGELSRFMGGHPLAEYLASIGIPEVEQARQREEEIVEIGNKVVSNGDPLQPRNVPDPPDFQPRNNLSSLFNQFTEGFSDKASQRGVQLQWIGVGTWKMPTKITNEVITGKHLDAWRLSRENMGRGSQGALGGLRQESQLQQTLRLIQKIPLARFGQRSSQTPEMSHRDILRDLLLGYREQLIETVELLVKSHRAIPPSLGKAITHIETVLGIRHWVGPAGSTTGSPRPRTAGSTSGTGVPSTPPVSPDEEALFEYLVQISGNDRERAIRLVELERKQVPEAERADWIQMAIEHFRRDNS
jgi:hypothetical protein